MLAINIATLRLLIGTVGATFAHTLVDTYAEPGQSLVDILLCAGHEAAAVSVLDTQDHVASMTTGEEIIKESGAHTADMQWPCGRRCETHPYFSLHNDRPFYN